MATIVDVAREAGVGIGTVSRVLNGGQLVSEATRARVLDAMHRLGYEPSPIARAFGARRTHTLELIVSIFTRGHFVEILRGVEQALVDTAFRFVIRTVENKADRDGVFERCCQRGRADGVLLIGVLPSDDLVARLQDQSVPIVLVNLVDSRLWSVSVDHDAAAAEAVGYCLRLGHRRIALVDRAEDPLERDSRGLCESGYRAALAEAGVPLPHGYQQRADPSPASAGAAVERLLRLNAAPTAILTASEVQAIGILQAARGLGLRVPEQLSVVGYNDSELSAYLGVTTMRVPLRDLGRTSTEVLLTALTEPEGVTRTTYLRAELTIRRTCASPPAAVA